MGAHPNWSVRFFARIVDDFIAAYPGTGSCSLGRIGDAESALLDAAKLVAQALPIMVGQAGDKRHFGGQPRARG